MRCVRTGHVRRGTLKPWVVAGLGRYGRWVQVVTVQWAYSRPSMLVVAPTTT